MLGPREAAAVPFRQWCGLLLHSPRPCDLHANLRGRLFKRIFCFPPPTRGREGREEGTGEVDRVNEKKERNVGRRRKETKRRKEEVGKEVQEEGQEGKKSGNATSEKNSKSRMDQEFRKGKRKQSSARGKQKFFDMQAQRQFEQPRASASTRGTWQRQEAE